MILTTPTSNPKQTAWILYDLHIAIKEHIEISYLHQLTPTIHFNADLGNKLNKEIIHRQPRDGREDLMMNTQPR